MRPTDQKAHAFAKTICPHSTFKSGNIALIAGWEIIEPIERAGQSLRVSRLEDADIHRIKLAVIKQKESGDPEKLGEFYSCPDCSGEYYHQSRHINLEKNKDGTVLLSNLIARAPAWRIKLIKLTGQN